MSERWFDPPNKGDTMATHPDMLELIKTIKVQEKQIKDLQRTSNEDMQRRREAEAMIGVIPTKLQVVLAKAVAHYNTALVKYPDKRSSPHEALSFLEEEAHELKIEVYKKDHIRSKPQMHLECHDIITTALRFILEIT